MDEKKMFDDLTEEQKENMVEFGMVSAHCTEAVSYTHLTLPTT